MFALVSSVAALVTAVAALVAILEMRRQRISSYKPELVLLPPKLRFEPSQDFPPLLCRRTDTLASENKPPRPVCVDCINVGVGAARDLLATWDFDHELAVAEISPFATHRGYSIWLDSSNTRVDLEEDGHTRMTSFTDNKATAGAPYLLPVQGAENVFEIPIPPDYLLFMRLGIYCVPGHPSNEGPRISLPHLPPLTLRLGYTDVGGARRCRIFGIDFRFSLLRSSSEPDARSSLEEAEATATVTSKGTGPWGRK